MSSLYLRRMPWEKVSKVQTAIHSIFLIHSVSLLVIDGDQAGHAGHPCCLGMNPWLSSVLYVMVCSMAFSGTEVRLTHLYFCGSFLWSFKQMIITFVNIQAALTSLVRQHCCLMIEWLYEHLCQLPCFPKGTFHYPAVAKSDGAVKTFRTCCSPEGGAEIIRPSLLYVKSPAVFNG